MEKIKQDEKTLKKFGMICAVLFLTLGVLAVVKARHNPISFFVVAAAAGSSALIRPQLLRPVHWVLMKAAFVLGWINTRVILFLLFYFIFTPTAIIMRLFKIDVLERKIEKQKQSYWCLKEKKSQRKEEYERQF